MINISVVLFCNPVQQIKNLLLDLSLSEQIQHIYLVDNSPDDDLHKLASMDSRMIYIHNPSNPGYGSSHNIAIKKSIAERVDYHVVANPDIRMGSEVLASLKAYMEVNLDVGLTMPDIRYPDGNRQHLCKLLPTPLSLFSRRFLPKAISRKFDKKYNLLDLNYEKEMNVPILSGCFMFLRTSALADVGLFDPRFFMYLEDFDLVRRINANHRTMFLPNVQVTHEYAKGSYQNKKLMIYHIQSAVKYFNKWGWLSDSFRRKTNKKFIRQSKHY